MTFRQRATRNFKQLSLALSGMFFLSCYLKSGLAMIPQDPSKAPQEKAAETKLSPDSDPAELLKKALASYSSAKTYAGSWTYSQVSGANISKLAVEIKVKLGKKALFRAAPPISVRNAGILASAPSVAAVLDGKTAWFESTDDQIYYKVTMPKEFSFSPLLFFPQMTGARDVKRMPNNPDNTAGDIVLQGESEQGAIITLVLDGKSFHLKSMSSESEIAGMKSITTLQVDKEVFDGDISDGVFNYKSPKGFKEIPPPPGAGAVFGLPG